MAESRAEGGGGADRWAWRHRLQPGWPHVASKWVSAALLCAAGEGAGGVWRVVGETPPEGAPRAAAACLCPALPSTAVPGDHRHSSSLPESSTLRCQGLGCRALWNSRASPSKQDEPPHVPGSCPAPCKRFIRGCTQLSGSVEQRPPLALGSSPVRLLIFHQ